MLKRKAYEKLLEWKQQQAGKTAVLIEGARRVGKSTLAKEFGLNEYKSGMLNKWLEVGKLPVGQS